MHDKDRFTRGDAVIRIVLPEDVALIIKELHRHGYQAYAVGGCIRDAVMGREPKDWDIATDAHPAEVGRLFDKTVDTGIKHGTVTVVLNGSNYEVTTFRVDGRYTDGRHPDRVEFTSRIEDDLRRRDFTINAMAWDPEKGIIDPFGGMKDISRRIIRTVGNPSNRFSEDALRMLRAVRFASTLGFGIEDGTLEGIRRNSGLISRISAERIREELTGILVSDDPMKFMILHDTGLLGHIMPELDKIFRPGGSLAGSGCSRAGQVGCRTGAGEHILRSVSAAEKDVCLRWAMLLHDAGGCTEACRSRDGYAGAGKLPGDGIRAGHAANTVNAANAENGGLPGPADAVEGGRPADAPETADMVLRRLKFDNKSRERILHIIRHLGMEIRPEKAAVARAVIGTGRDGFADILKAKRAHIAASEEKIARMAASGSCRCTGNIPGEWHREADGQDVPEELRQLERTEAVFRSLLESGYCLSLKELKINGDDLKRLGFREGAEIGKVLEHLLERVINEPELNKKEILEKLALEHLYDII